MVLPILLPRVQSLLPLPLCSEVTQRRLKKKSKYWQRSLSRRQRAKGFPQQPRSVLVGLGLRELLLGTTLLPPARTGKGLEPAWVGPESLLWYGGSLGTERTGCLVKQTHGWASFFSDSLPWPQPVVSG